MDKNLLNRYFEKRCSAEEIKIVEKWLLDPNNQTEFNLFLESRWHDFVGQDEQAAMVSIRESKFTILWKAAAAIVLLAGSFYLYHMKQLPVISQNTPAIVDNTLPLPRSTSARLSPLDTFHVNTNPNITKQHERKITQTSRSHQTLTQIDTSKRKKEMQAVKATKLGNFMVNEVLLSQLRHKIDSNQLVLNIDLHEATIAEIAYRLRKNYGIILEPCNSEASAKTYTARFEKISINDLLNDMSQKMLFSYTVQDSVIKVCFN